jgi:hypothetical protein
VGSAALGGRGIGGRTAVSVEVVLRTGSEPRIIQLRLIR